MTKITESDGHFSFIPLQNNYLKTRSIAYHHFNTLLLFAMEYNELISELAKGSTHGVNELIEYMPNAVVSKTILRKSTGNITISSFAAGEELPEKQLPFDSYIQILDGKASITIDRININLSAGEGIIIPAHSRHKFNAKEQFKMLTTTIKSGYEALG